MTAMGHEPTMITLTVQQLPGNRWRLASPLARGWSAVVSTPHELARATQVAFREVGVAAYARQRGETYDLEWLENLTAAAVARDTPAVAKPPMMRKPKRHDPMAWEELPNGRWRCPSGRTFRADAQQVQNVLRLRAQIAGKSLTGAA